MITAHQAVELILKRTGVKAYNFTFASVLPAHFDNNTPLLVGIMKQPQVICYRFLISRNTKEIHRVIVFWLNGKIHRAVLNNILNNKKTLF